MHAQTPSRFLSACVVLTVLASVRPAIAQPPSPGDHQHDAAVPPATSGGQGHEMHDMEQMSHDGMSMPASRDGSGTSWLPDESLMYAVHGQRGPWTLMGHGNVFLQYLHDSGNRGNEQAGSVNWVMLMADRTFAEG